MALQSLFTCDEFNSLLYETGYSKPSPTLTAMDKEDIISSVVEYHCMIKGKAGMDQFIEGLEAGGILSFVRRYPLAFKELFTPSPSKLSAG